MDTHTFIQEQKGPYLPLPSQQKLVLRITHSVIGSDNGDKMIAGHF